jgi:adenosylcobinamide-GDP ribazoletransferase
LPVDNDILTLYTVFSKAFLREVTTENAGTLICYNFSSHSIIAIAIILPQGGWAVKKFCLALSFLTIFPCSPRSPIERGELAAAAAYFPLVGAMLGLFMGGAVYLLRLLIPSGPLAALVLAASFLLTRGLHLDGLADTADGLIGAMDREKALKIMRDSVVGSMGVCALLFVYLFKYAALLAVDTPFFPLAIFSLPFCGRWAMVLAGAAFAPARPDGLGNQFIGELGWKHFLYASFFGAAVIAATVCFCSHFIFPMLCGIAVAFTLSLLLSVYAAGRLGGLTGDILGAVNEIAEAGFLLGVIIWN